MEAAGEAGADASTTIIRARQILSGWPWGQRSLHGF